MSPCSTISSSWYNRKIAHGARIIAHFAWKEWSQFVVFTFLDLIQKHLYEISIVLDTKTWHMSNCNVTIETLFRQARRGTNFVRSNWRPALTMLVEAGRGDAACISNSRQIST